MKKLYTKEGYINYSAIINSRYPFTVIYGGRGIGKTYGILQHCIKNSIPFIYMRRSQAMVDQLGTAALNPAKAVFNDMGEDCGVKKAGKYIVRFLQADGSEVGIMVALSTFANLRGFDASQYKILIFDEFIPQEEERKIKAEGTAFLNAIETISRNREIQGKEPILSFLLTNANALNSEILLSLNLFDYVLRMQTAAREWHTVPDRGLQLIRPVSKISAAKKETSLYKFAGTGDFADMAIENVFKKPDALIKSYDLRGWKPYFYLPDYAITVYKKGKRYYVCHHFSGEPKNTYILDKKGLIRFEREQSDFRLAIQEHRAAFQDLKLYYEVAGIVNLA